MIFLLETWFNVSKLKSPVIKTYTFYICIESKTDRIFNCWDNRVVRIWWPIECSF